MSQDNNKPCYTASSNVSYLWMPV